MDLRAVRDHPGVRNVLGGGFLIFGILVLPVEHDLLKLFGEAAEFAFVLGLFNTLQTDVKGLFRSVNGRHSIASLD
jgi:hypothetical protein